MVHYIFFESIVSLDLQDIKIEFLHGINNISIYPEADQTLVILNSVFSETLGSESENGGKSVTSKTI